LRDGVSESQGISVRGVPLAGKAEDYSIDPSK